MSLYQLTAKRGNEVVRLRYHDIPVMYGAKRRLIALGWRVSILPLSAVVNGEV